VADTIALAKAMLRRNLFAWGPSGTPTAFAFHAEPSAIVTLTSPLAATNAPGFLLSSSAGSAKIYATPGMRGGLPDPVSYTHLTLPTICSV